MKKNHTWLIVVALIVVALVAVGIYAMGNDSRFVSSPPSPTNIMSSPSPSVMNSNPTQESSTSAPEVSVINIYLVYLSDSPTSASPVSSLTPESNTFDSGASTFGCGDTLVAVERKVEPTTMPLTTALEQLLKTNDRVISIDDQELYNAFYRSNLSVESAEVDNGTATIALTGDLSIGGVCDGPRIQRQLEATAMQFGTINVVDITVNGKPLDEVLDLQG